MCRSERELGCEVCEGCERRRRRLYIYLTSDRTTHTYRPYNSQSDIMASGVKVDEAVKIKYDDIKKKKTHRYLVFYIKDEKMICVEKVGTRDAPYSSFLTDLKAAGDEDCR